MMQDQEALENAMNSASGKIQRDLKIASSINFADYELPALLKSFREQYPDVHIQVKTAFSHQVVKCLILVTVWLPFLVVAMKYLVNLNYYWRNRIVWFIKN